MVGGGKESRSSDPGSELRLGGKKEKRKGAKIMGGMSKQTKSIGAPDGR